MHKSFTKILARTNENDWSQSRFPFEILSLRVFLYFSLLTEILIKIFVIKINEINFFLTLQNVVGTANVPRKQQRAKTVARIADPEVEQAINKGEAFMI